MRNDRSVAARHPYPALALVATAAFALALTGVAAAQEVAHGVTVLLPPSYQPPQESSAVPSPAGDASPSEPEGVPRGDGPLIVLTAAPPPVPGWERPPEIEVIGLEDAEDVIVYSPAPLPMPGWRKLRGVDIGYHRIAQPPEPSRIRTHFGPSDGPTRIAHHDGRSADPTRIPTAGSGSALVAQSWNPSGARYQASRIRYHGWSRGRGDER